MKQATVGAIAGLAGSAATITSLYMTTRKLGEMLDEDYNPNHELSQCIKAGVLGSGAGAISGAIGALVMSCVVIELSPFVK